MLKTSRVRPVGHLRQRVVVVAAAILTLHGVARAQTTVTISMAAAPATPRILPPYLVGAVAGAPFMFTIPATGQAPLTFAATGLPTGLAIAAATGTISGTAPATGMYPVTITATNGMGSATATLTINSGKTLALTPPMGWNSYDSFGSSVSESETIAAAQAVKSILQPYGWNTVVVDYLWYDPEQTIDANGRWVPSPSKFPSSKNGQGLKPLADMVHGMGLSFGIHLMRGIPRKAVTANSPIADSSYTASQAGDTSDACPWDSHMWGVRGDMPAGQAWYDSIFKEYAAWGLDFVKIDDMINNNTRTYHSSEADAIRASIDKTGRPMVFSLSPGPMQTRDVANLNMNANMWRMVNDFWDTSSLSSFDDEFNTANSWQMTAGITPGHWPDQDMLPLGYIGPRPPVGGGARQSALSHNQQVMVMTLWGILPSPLMFGGNPTKLMGDAWTTALLTNEEVLAVNQDAAGTRAKRISSQGGSTGTEVWARDLSGGRKAVALINRGTQDAMVSATFAQLSVTGPVTVRDAWQRADVTSMMASGLAANVPHESAVLYVLTPPGGAGGTGGGAAGAGGQGTGGGGAGGMGTAGTAGATGTGGATITGAAGSPAGAAGAGPTGSAGNGGSGQNGGGATGAAGQGAGSTGSAGADQGAGHSGVGAGGASGKGSSGGGSSGCSVGGGATNGVAGSTVMFLLVALGWRTRPRRRTGRTA